MRDRSRSTANYKLLSAMKDRTCLTPSYEPVRILLQAWVLLPAPIGFQWQRKFTRPANVPDLFTLRDACIQQHV